MKYRIGMTLGKLLLFWLVAAAACMGSGRTVFAGTDADLLEDSGYFYVEVVDGSVTSRIRVTLDYATRDDENQQKVAVSVSEESASNSHSLTCKKAGKTVRTQPGSSTVKDGEKVNTDITGTDINGNTIYQTKAYCILYLGFEYQQTAYTYAARSTSGACSDYRFNDREYDTVDGWMNAGAHTLETGTWYAGETTQTFHLQVNIAQTAAYGSFDNGTGGHPTFTITLTHPSLTVSYDGNGAESGSLSNTKVSYNSLASLRSGAKLKKEYDTLTKWNTKADGSGTDFELSGAYTAWQLYEVSDALTGSGASVPSSGGYGVTLYAQWTVQTYTIHFDANGGSGVMADMSCSYGADYCLTENRYQQPGYAFTGWNTGADGNGTAYEDVQSVKNLGNITLYAQWRRNGYTIRFDPNDGTLLAPIADIVTAYDTEVTLPDIFLADGSAAYERKLSYAGKNGDEKEYDSVFKGWSMEENRTGFVADYAAGETVKNLTDAKK